MFVVKHENNDRYYELEAPALVTDHTQIRAELTLGGGADGGR